MPRKGRGRPRENPERIVAAKGYDSDALRDGLKRRGIELICPYRGNRKRRKHYDGRKLRRYKRCWEVERTFSWFGTGRPCDSLIRGAPLTVSHHGIYPQGRSGRQNRQWCGARLPSRSVPHESIPYGPCKTHAALYNSTLTFVALCGPDALILW